MKLDDSFIRMWALMLVCVCVQLLVSRDGVAVLACCRSAAAMMVVLEKASKCPKKISVLSTNMYPRGVVSLFFA